MNIEEIEIFARVDASRHAAVAALFSASEHEKGTVILRHGEPVDGLYLLEKGEVDISIPGFEGTLATLGEGKAFGELSLFNLQDTASATVTVSSDTAVLNFCPRDALLMSVANDELLAAGFYHSCALLVSDRLRTTNAKISGEIAKSAQMASMLIEEISTSGNLIIAQEELEAAGTSIVSGMTSILKSLLVMKQGGEAIPPEEIAALADKAKEIYYQDFQVFEKVHQQLGTLGKHLENVNRILSQQDVLEVEGEMELLDF